MRRAQTQKGFFDSGPGASPIAAAEALRISAQRCLRELQPAGHEVTARPAESKGHRPDLA